MRKNETAPVSTEAAPLKRSQSTGFTGIDRVKCPRCRAEPGQPCNTVTPPWRTRDAHAARIKLAAHRIAWEPGPDGDPVAVVVEVTAGAMVRIRCPLCSGEHWHGWQPDMALYATSRVAHCWIGRDWDHVGYWIPACGPADPAISKGAS